MSETLPLPVGAACPRARGGKGGSSRSQSLVRVSERCSLSRCGVPGRWSRVFEGGCQGMGAGGFQWSPTAGREAIGTN